MNPLVTIQFRIPFDQIRAEHVEPAIAELLAEARASQKALSESTGPRTFENTLLALEAVTEKLDYAMGVFRHHARPGHLARHQGIRGHPGGSFAHRHSQAIPLKDGRFLPPPGRRSES